MIIRGRPLLTSVAVLACLIAWGIPVAGDKQDSRRVDEVKKRLKLLRTVPYTNVSSEKADLTTSGVTIHKKEEIWEGYNLYCVRSRSEAVLIDMNGDVAHKWTYPVADTTYTWNHAIMLDNGDLIVIRTYHDLLRLDWHSNRVWSADIEAHHDVVQSPDGDFYAVVREAEDYRELKIPFPAVARLSPDGKELGRWRAFTSFDDIKRKFDTRLIMDTFLDSLLVESGGPNPEATQALEKSVMSGVGSWLRRVDQFHMNTVSITPDTPAGRRDSRFRAGNFLICFRNLNQIAVLEQDTWEILWTWGADDLDWPHLPIMMESGSILVFDNGAHRAYSRVIAINPITEKIEWEYIADPPGAFFSYQKGSAQRFPNGNTLICEGDRGRCFEIRPDGEIVWEWFNPAIKKGHREQIYRMWRIETEIVEPLLEKYATRGHRP
jgi:hypothetical protein